MAIRMSDNTFSTAVSVEWWARYAQLAWLVDPYWTLYPQSGYMSTIDQAYIRESPPATEPRRQVKLCLVHDLAAIYLHHSDAMSRICVDNNLHRPKSCSHHAQTVDSLIYSKIMSPVLNHVFVSLMEWLPLWSEASLHILFHPESRQPNWLTTSAQLTGPGFIYF